MSGIPCELLEPVGSPYFLRDQIPLEENFFEEVDEVFPEGFFKNPLSFTPARSLHLIGAAS